MECFSQVTSLVPLTIYEYILGNLYVPLTSPCPDVTIEGWNAYRK